MKEVIEKRIIEIETALAQAVANHSLLSGHLAEAKFILQSIFAAECVPKIAEAAEAITDEAKECAAVAD